MSRAPAGRCSASTTIFSPAMPMSQRIVSAAVATMPLRMVRSSGSIRVPGAWCGSRRSITLQKQKGRGPEAAPTLKGADALGRVDLRPGEVAGIGGRQIGGVRVHIHFYAGDRGDDGDHDLPGRSRRGDGDGPGARMLGSLRLIHDG